MDGCRAAVVAEKYAAEIEAVRDELPDLEHVLVRDSEYEAWLARRSAVDPDPPSLLKIISSSATPAARPAAQRMASLPDRVHMRLTGAANAPPTCSRFPASRRP